MVGVLAEGARHLVQEAFHHEGGVGVADRAKPEGRHDVLRGVQVDQQVGDGIGEICGPLDRGVVDPVLDQRRLEGGPRDDRLPHDGVLPGGELPVGSEAGADPVVPHGTIISPPGVVLPGPDHLQRLFHRLGDLHRLDHEVRGGIGAAPETSAQQRGFQGHLLGLETCRLGRRGAVHGLELRSGAHQAAVRLQVDEAVERLHRGVGEVGDVVLRLQHALRIGKGGRGIPLAPGHQPRSCREPGIGGMHSRRGQLRPRPLRPVGFQQLTPLFGLPEAVGHHGHPGGDRHHEAHPCGLFCPGGVHAPQGGAKYRRPQHERGQHARGPDVAAEERAAGDFGRAVGAPQRFSQQPVVLGVLQFNLCGDREPGGLFRQRPVPQALTRRTDHRAVFGPTGAGAHLPALRGRLHQHLAGARSGGRQAVPLAPDAAAAAGDHHAEGGVVVGRSDRRGLDPDLAPVAVEFLRDQHRERGVHPLSHLRLADDDRGAAVARNAQEGVGGEGGCRGPPGGSQGGNLAGDDQAAPEYRPGLEEIAPAYSLVLAHNLSPKSTKTFENRIKSSALTS